MKHLTHLIAITLLLMVLTGCVDGNVTKLKKQVAIADAGCPMNMGIIGDFTSIKYQEKENRVILYYSVNEDIGGSIFFKGRF